MSIKYEERTNRVQQELESISFYNLEGEYEFVIKWLQNELEDYKKVYSTPKKMRETHYKGGAYADGTSEKTVIFDKFYIVKGQDYEGKDQLQAWGERDLLPEEVEGLKKQRSAAEDQQKEYRRKQYEAFKKEFECK